MDLGLPEFYARIQGAAARAVYHAWRAGATLCERDLGLPTKNHKKLLPVRLCSFCARTMGAA